MKHIHIRIGLEEIDGARGLFIAVNVQSTKPLSDHAKNMLAVTILVMLLAATIYAMRMTDVLHRPHETADLSNIIR